MIFYYADLLDENRLLFLVLVSAFASALLLGIAFHEFCHAYVASALGDQTARRMGRVSLNPLVHLDPFGTIMLFVVGFGWGKPVPVNPNALRNGPRNGGTIVSGAGPLSNLVVATLMALPIRFGIAEWHDPFRIIPNTIGWDSADYLGVFLSAAVLINVILALFNLLPIAPLDGFRFWTGLLPVELARPIARTEQYGILILMGLMFVLPMIFNINVFSEVMRPAAAAIADGLTGV